MMGLKFDKVKGNLLETYNFFDCLKIKKADPFGDSVEKYTK